MRVLVSGAPDARGALAGVRALSAAGWTVEVAVPRARGLAAASRHAAARHDVPSPEADPRAYADAVAALVARGRHEVVLPAGDAELIALSLHRERIGAPFAGPPHEVLLRALDKLELTRAARAVGVATPRTWSASEPVPHDVSGPLVVKGRLHLDPGAGDGRARRDARIVETASQLDAVAAAVAGAGADAVVQERIAGTLVALTAVRRPDGTLAGAVEQRADRTFPADAGVTSAGRTVATDAGLCDAVDRLLAELGWTGLAQVQFIDPGDGRPRLIDLNGRLYGSLALAVAAGVNLPHLWAAVVTGQPAGNPPARAGVRYQWLEGDLRLAPLRALGLAPRATHSVLDLRDPRPAVTAAVRVAGRLRRHEPRG